MCVIPYNHMYGYSNVVNLLDSSPGTAFHLQCRGLGYESCNKDLYMQIKWAWLLYGFYVTFAFVNTID